MSQERLEISIGWESVRVFAVVEERLDGFRGVEGTLAGSATLNDEQPGQASSRCLVDARHQVLDPVLGRWYCSLNDCVH